MTRVQHMTQVFRFAGVGVVCSVLYLALATGFSSILGMAAMPSSFLAYGFAAIFGYNAHRRVTFVSSSDVGREASRFFVATGVGLLISLIVPLILRDQAPMLSFLTVLVIVPGCSFLMMKFFCYKI